MSEGPSWYERGKEALWYPYTQMSRERSPLRVAEARGSRLILEDGRQLVDGVASWWSVCHGYRHPHITEAVKRQADLLPHVMLADTAHEQAFLLAARLAAFFKLPRVFLTDSGSTAVETAMKMAVQYRVNRGEPRRNKFICFRGGYHGDTMGCMSVCDPEQGMHASLKGYMPEQFSVPFPQDEYAFAELEEVMAAFAHQITALIMEPMAQGAGGMRFHGADVTAEIRRLCAKHDVLFIADEVMTGFYRLGSPFACAEAGVSPDILCCGKALTGGFMTLAATLASEEVFSAFLGPDESRALMSGPTYCGNALACAAANASLDLFETNDYAAMTAALERDMWHSLSPLSELKAVREVRVKGALAAVECAMTRQDVLRLREAAPSLGVFLRPFGDVIYLCPPLNVNEEDLATLCSAVTTLARSL